MYEHITSYSREKQLASLTASITTKFLQPTIDKLTLLADFRNPEANLETLQKHNDCLDIISNHDRHYEYQLRTASDIRITFTLQPARQVPNLRIEFNPNKFDTTGSLWLTLLPMLKNKRYTRIDYAIDYNCDLSEYQWSTERGRKGNIYHGSNGEYETIYLGVRNSADQYRIYDKAKERGESDSLTTSLHWRIEQQFTLDKQTSPFSINPFANLIGWKPDTFTGDYKDDLILSDLHANPNNWKRLTRHETTKFRRLIKDANRVCHMPVKPVTTFNNGYPLLETFLRQLLA